MRRLRITIDILTDLDEQQVVDSLEDGRLEKSGEIISITAAGKELWSSNAKPSPLDRKRP